MAPHASQTPLASAVAWALAQAGTDVLADPARLGELLAKAPVADSPEQAMLARNLDAAFLAPFAEAAAEGQPDEQALANATQAAKRHLTEACFIDERIAETAATQFADGIAATYNKQAALEATAAEATVPGTTEPKAALEATAPQAAPAATSSASETSSPAPSAAGTAPADPASPSVGMKTYAQATGDHDSLSARVNAATAFLGQRKVRTLAACACALALGAYLLFSFVAPSKARLTFHGNGATGGIMMSITADQGSLVELPLCGFRRDGYEFVGWYNENTHELLLAQSLVTAQGRVSYMAEWAPIVQFDKGGASGSVPEPITVTRGDTIELPKASLSKAPYEFLGWSVAGDETSWHVPGETVAISGPTTFVATWGYTLSFRGNGATEGHVDTIKALEGDKVRLPENSYAFADHKFSGWAQDLSETKPAKPGEEVTVGRSLVFHAIWRSKVTFEGGEGATGTTKSFYAKTSGRLTLPECGFARKGYRFVGWNITAPMAVADEPTEAADTVEPVETDGTQASEAAEGITPAPPELHQPGEKLTIAQPTTFYAWWEPVEEQQAP